MDYITEPAHQTPIVRDVDVLVVGGGTAGVPAAVAAARNGAKTLLVERYGHLGGYYDLAPGSGALGVFTQDTTGKPVIKGITQEMLDRMVALHGAVPALRRKLKTSGGWPTDTPYGMMKPHTEYEAVRSASLQICEEAGVELLLHSCVFDVVMEGDTLRGIVVLNKAGRQALLAKVIVDCTGDGDVAALADAPFSTVDRQTVYQISRNATLAGVDTDMLRARAEGILANEADKVGTMVTVDDPSQIPPGFERPLSVSYAGERNFEVSEDGLDYRRAGSRGGARAGQGVSVGYRKGIALLTASVDGYDGLDPFDLTRAEVAARQKLIQMFENLRQNVPGYENCYMLSTGSSINLGVRETRQILGGYVFTADDVVWGRKFDDSIARAANQIDMHLQGSASEIRGVKTDYYDIPYRCIVPQKVENLLVAGRCISCTHDAQAALRKVPICSATGEAAGTAAALAVKRGVTPRRLDVKALQVQLEAQGAW